MLELIFQGFVEWIYGMVLECWEYFASALLEVMSMDFAYLRSHIPVLAEIQQILLAVGWALLIGNLVFQALKSMSTGLGFEGEDPKLLFTRTFVFAFLLLASPQICEIGLNVTQTIINYLDIPDAVNITFADDASFAGLAAAWLLVVICGLIVMFKVFSLILEIAERYIILAVLTLCAPLAFGVGGSRNTSDIFTGWCRMFGSMCLVMVTNVIFLKMLLSVLAFVPSGLDVLPWMVLVFGIVKVAKKIDAIITRIGLNPAITGDGLGGRGLPGTLTYAVVRTVGRQVARSAGRNAGGKGHGGSTAPPGGGPNGPKPGPVFGRTRFSGASGTVDRPVGADTPGGQQAGAAQGSAAPQAPGNPTHSGVTQGAVAQFGGQYTDARQQNAGAYASVGGMDSVAQSTAAYQSSSMRKTFVTPGTHRGVSHIPRAGRPGMAGTAPPKAGDAGQGAAGQGPYAVPSGIAGTDRFVGAVDMHSCAAGTGQPRADTPADHRAPSGTAGKAPAQPARFTAVSSQRVNEGGADSRIAATEQAHISVKQGRQTRGAAAEHRQSASPTGQGASAKQSPGATRFTSRPADPTRAAERTTVAAAPSAKAGASARTSTAALPVRPVPAGTQTVGGVPRAGAAGAASDQTRHSRNAPHSGGGHPDRSPPSPARQERPAASTHPASKVGGPAPHSGTAGTGARRDKPAQTRQTAQKQAPASKPTPTATVTSGGRRPSSGTSAQQEQRRTDERRRGSKPRNGGIRDGK